MKAEDTVMDELEMRIVLNKASWESPTIPLSYHTAIAKAQAEITAPIFFKAGRESFLDDVGNATIPLSEVYDKAYKAGYEKHKKDSKSKVGW